LNRYLTLLIVKLISNGTRPERNEYDKGQVNRQPIGKKEKRYECCLNNAGSTWVGETTPPTRFLFAGGIFNGTLMDKVIYPYDCRDAFSLHRFLLAASDTTAVY
jgi:hypothetical protein